MVTQSIYTVLVGLVAVERLFELAIARRNMQHQLERGGVEYGGGHYPFMVVLHTGLLLGCVAETWMAPRPFVPLIGIPMFVVVVLSQMLRYWVVSTLGRQWTTRVVVVPGDRRVRSGPFKWFGHPNYVAVVAEGIALPMVHTNWITATVFSIANAFLLARRIRIENEALRDMEAAS
jgi:methyltransferase